MITQCLPTSLPVPYCFLLFWLCSCPSLLHVPSHCQLIHQASHFLPFTDDASPHCHCLSLLHLIHPPLMITQCLPTCPMWFPLLFRLCSSPSLLHVPLHCQLIHEASHCLLPITHCPCQYLTLVQPLTVIVHHRPPSYPIILLLLTSLALLLHYLP
jgi:hypothetical protein